MTTNGADQADFERDAPEWARLCLARMLELDPSADPALLVPIVANMSRSESWRTRSPQAAAEWCFGPLKTPDPGSL